MSNANQKLKDRIRALREKTAARGCTEAEAIAAAEKAAQLMRDHGLSDADLTMDEQASASGHGRSVKAKLWPAIARCTNTAHIVVRTPGIAAEVQFLGRSPGPMVAIYLRDVCEGAVDRAVREFKTTSFYRRRRGLKSKRAAVADFVDGMVNRLRWRLLDVFAPSIDAAAQDEASRALAERYSDIRTIKATAAPMRHSAARAAGWHAGERVTLAHGVGSAEAPRQIGCVR